MTGKERFAAILNHQRPDKMPLYIPTIACTVASEILGRPALGGADSLHFKEELARCQGKDALEDFEGRYFEDAVALYRELRVDIIRQTWRMRGTPSKRLDENTLLFGDEDGEHLIKRFFPETQSYGTLKSTYKPLTPEGIIQNIKEQLKKPPHKATKEGALAGIAGHLRIFDMMRDEEKGELIPGYGVPLHLFVPAWLEAMYMEPELFNEYLLWGVDSAIENMEFLADMGYTYFSGGGDLAGNTGPLFSSAMCEAILTQTLTKYAAACKRKGVVFAYCTDGNIWDIFDALIKKPGVQSFGEVDRTAGMSVKRIKEAHPDLIVLGNMCVSFLQLATEEQVRENQRIQLEESQGVNFIPGPSNAIVHGTPVRNIYAMIEEIEKYKP